MFGNSNTLTAIKHEYGPKDTIEPIYLLNNIGTELLNRKGTNIPDELTNDCIAEPVVIEVENVLDDLKKQIRQARTCFFVEKE